MKGVNSRKGAAPISTCLIVASLLMRRAGLPIWGRPTMRLRYSILTAMVLLGPAGGLGAHQIVLATHYVSKTGSDVPPYETPETAASSIADAIAVSGESSRIVVGEGVYEGNITLTRRRTLFSESAERAVIRGQPQGRSSSAVTLEGSAMISGFTIDGNGSYSAVSCAAGTPTLSGCVITGGDTAGVYVGSSATWIESCVIRGNGYAGVFCSGGFLVLSDCILSANNIGVLPFEETLILVTHCTIAHNFGAGLDGVEGELAVRHSIIWGNGHDLYYVAPWEVVDSDVGDPEFSGFNGNISADPLFVGWGEFNDSDNPIFVNPSHTGLEQGTETNPFRSIGAALDVHDYRLAVGSPCVAAASDGRNIGAFPDETPVRGPGSQSVLVNVAPGLYREGKLPLLSGVYLKGPGPCLATISPPRFCRALRLWENSTLDGFSIVVARSSAIQCAGGSEPTIANCTISSSEVSPHYGADVAILSGYPKVFNCVIYGMRHPTFGAASMTNCVITGNLGDPTVFPRDSFPTITNSIVWANSTQQLGLPTENVSHSLVSDPAFAGINGNIMADPQFVDAENRDFRLSPFSPCIDAGDNTTPDLPDNDIAGMHRIMFGGKSLTVDMGAYEFYINRVAPVPGTDEAVFTWSSLADKTYSIFYSPDLLTWHLVVENFPSAGNETSSWIDDGSLTGLPPSLAPLRFYRVLENL